MSPYRDQDPVDIRDELRGIQADLARIADDVQALRMAEAVKALERQPRRWTWPRPPSPAVCFVFCAATQAASIIARVVLP